MKAGPGGAGDQTYTTTNSVVNGTSNIYEVVQQPAAAGNYTNVAFYLAGAAQTGAGAIGAKTWIPSAMNRTKNYIGRSNWSADNYFSGTMSELLLYNVTFNTTQRVIMENYLSAEWGKSVSVSKFTPPTSTTYNTNLVGVGYTSSTDNFLTNPSGSTDGLGFSSSSGASGFLNTAGYLMAAHNAQSNTVLSNVNIGIASASSISRWNRSWNVQKTGGNSSGQITLNFNFSDYNGTTPSSANSYALLYNATDGTFPSGSNSLVLMYSTPVISGNIVSITVNASLLANGYYTIVYSATPLPVELKGFTATRQENSALLKWSVALESGIDHYEIQRGANANEFVTVGSVAAGNTNTLTAQYSFTDDAPASGRNYYRLRIVDRDDIDKYSIVIPLDFPVTGSGAIRLYPNPTVDLLHIALTGASGVVSALVINTQGQVVRSVRSASSRVIDIPVNDLSKGIYIVEIETGAAKYVEKVMKN